MPPKVGDAERLLGSTSRAKRSPSVRVRQPRTATTKPSIATVAALAGVSVATVSRALNKFDCVLPETRGRVERAADLLGYAALRSASAMAQRKSQQSRVLARDVAARVGVSPATVSRALNEHCPIAADTRARVLQAVADLGYTPFAPAAELSRHRR